MENISNEITSIIQELANQLGIAVDILLNAYAPYYTGVNIASAFLACTIFIVSLIGSIKCIKKIVELMESDDKNDMTEIAGYCYIILLCVLAVVCIISIICVAVTFPNAIGCLCSPTGATINHIVSMIG